jgi:hypothetical protein
MKKPQAGTSKAAWGCARREMDIPAGQRRLSGFALGLHGAVNVDLADAEVEVAAPADAQDVWALLDLFDDRRVLAVQVESLITIQPPFMAVGTNRDSVFLAKSREKVKKTANLTYWLGMVQKTVHS